MRSNTRRSKTLKGFTKQLCKPLCGFIEGTYGSVKIEKL